MVDPSAHLAKLARSLGAWTNRYRRDLLKAVAQRVDVTPKGGLRVSGCKVELLRAISANNGVESAAPDVRTHEPAWRPLSDEADQYAYAIVLQRLPRSDKGCKRGRRTSRARLAKDI